MPLKPRYAPIKMTRRHNHFPEEVDNTLFYYILKQRARDEKDKSLRMIYDEEATRNPDFAASFPFIKAKQAMQRARRRSYEDQDTSLDESIENDQSPVSSRKQTPVSHARQSSTPDSPLVSRRRQTPSDVIPVSVKLVSLSDDKLPVSSKRPSAKVGLVDVDDLSTNVPLQQIFIGSGQKIADSKIFYECPYCKRLFDKEDQLDQHMLDDHVNSLIIEEQWPDDPDNPGDPDNSDNPENL